MDPLKDIEQRTVWSSTADIPMKGYQLQVIMDLATLFRPFVQVADQILQQAVQTGAAKVEYIDKNGQVVDPELVQQAYEALQKPAAEQQS